MSNQPKHPTHQQLQQQLVTPTGGTTSTSAPRPPLRRATYVHVSDLTSAYNIDHSKLEEELSRVNAERDESGGTSLVAGEGVGTKSYASTVKETAAASSDQQSPYTATSAVAVAEEAVVVAADIESDLVAPVAAQKQRLQPPRGGFNLCVLVGAVNVVVDKRRVDQSRVRLAEVAIGDETGTVSLRARDGQIDVLEEISSRRGAAVLRNATIELYQGKHIRLAVTKWGKISLYPDNIASTPPPPSKMNLDRNFSLIDLSIVATEMVQDPPVEVPSYSSSRTSKASVEPSDEGKGKGSGTTQSSNKPSGQKTSQSSQGKAQTQSSSRKNTGKSNNDRRQSKGKGSSPAPKPSPIQYTSIQAETRPAAQPQHMIYQSIPGYSNYEQAMDMRQYQFTHHPSRHQEVMSTQQLLMQQQFEMQQRQLHHMYSQQQQHDRQRHQHHGSPHAQQMMHQQQSHAALISGMGSFDTASYQGEPSEQHHASHYHTQLSSSPIMVPMGIPGTASMSTSSPSEQYSSPTLESMPQEMLSQRSSGTMSPFPVGHINPDASSFTPSYLNVTQGGQQAPAPLPHLPYDLQHSPHRPDPSLYQSQPNHHSFYPHTEMAHPPRAPGHVYHYEGERHTDRRKTGPSTSEPSSSDTSPQLSGKENVTSPP
eukprot:CAMPEP_0113504398 /NCGR_PEP_ID=MMETSP0014_2-20120614/34694_1 /TAXON_ID=2857 /ORGANISM="Nitzschia sp." /LENGTH=650 /DNA_ID=CAMNT_0000399505 /DNA_START=47 /DNA_END=1999 /DNA_ORIENTATION=- /assembly_acc=CAM_ASM_000159